LVQNDSSFAGHSLGEYSALAALAEVMPIESLVSVVFYRGLTMQVAVERDETGRSNYAMCAVNPSRISKTFNEQALQYVVENIADETGWLLEIVNLNVANMQYVCAGDLRALDCLTNVTNYLKSQKIDINELTATLSLEDVKTHLRDIIKECAKTTLSKPMPIELQRGFATIPLRGIDVPFHSTFLRSGVKPFRNFLLKKINKTSIDPSKLVGKYIPNVTARPFELTKEYFEDVYRLTNSPRIGNILANWERSTRAAKFGVLLQRRNFFTRHWHTWKTKLSEYLLTAAHVSLRLLDVLSIDLWSLADWPGKRICVCLCFP